MIEQVCTNILDIALTSVIVLGVAVLFYGAIRYLFKKGL